MLAGHPASRAPAVHTRALAPPRAPDAAREYRVLTSILRRPAEAMLDRVARDIGLAITDAHRERVAHEQLRMVLLHTRLGTLAATAFAVLLVAHLSGQLSDPQAGLLHGWLALKVGIALARVALAAAYRRRGASGAAWVRWQRAMLAMLALDGAVWGLLGWHLVAQPVPVAALAVAALDGVSCIATFGLQARLAATAAYVLPMLLPVAAGLALRADGLAAFAAAGQLILLLLLLGTAHASARQLTLLTLLRLQADQLATEKDAALRLAQEQSAERSRFLAKVSHELRTPLHGILGLARLLHLESADATTSHRLELIESSGTHLLGLINDLLEVSRMDAGHFELQRAPFDLAAQLDELADLFSLRAADKGLRFDLHSTLPHPCWVLGDAARLRQVLSNLLGNALKFTREGGIALHAGPGTGPGRVRLAVLDSGPGIAPEALARIFQPFQQAGAGGGPSAEGVGLGLTIAREIAQAMDGDIRVDSAPGQGARFSVEVALPPASPDAGAPPPPPDGALPRLVLVAEDDEVNALIVGAYLDSLGVRHERVADGKQAVGHALRETDRPELVLMDCRMPVMDGLAAAAEIRRQERTLGLARLPILALTATSSDEDRQACLHCGMDGLLAKPFTPVQLAQALRQTRAGRARGR